MASPTSPQHSPLSCQYCYKYTPSSSTSICPNSYFALSCNFDKLAKEYPDFFQSALDDHLNGKQCGSHVSQQQQKQSRLQQKQECGINSNNNDKDMPDSSSMSSINNNNTYHTTTLSTAQRTHNFNTSLTRALLNYHFHIQLPSLPEGHLCPPIPNRANYICWLNELLIQSQVDLYRFATASSCGSKEKKKSGSREIYKQLWQCQGIDIGTGVSAIYPLLLTTELFSGSSGDNDNEEQVSKATSASPQQQKQWKFLATDIDPIAIQSAKTNVQANHLENQIHIVQVKKNENDETIIDDTPSQGMNKGPLFSAMEEAKHHSAFQSSSSMLDETVHEKTKKEEMVEYPKFDFVMTNPPFYSTIDEAKKPRAGDKRCRTGMSTNEGVYSIDMDENNNDEGGDVGFVTAIMNDSQHFRQHVTWYTSLIAKRSSLDTLLSKLQTLDGVWGNRGQIRTVEFHQANLDTNTNESDSSNKKSSSNRVRWGIGWTYERAIGRCSSCRVRGGLQSFHVSIDVGDNTTDNTMIACDEVVSRLTSYFENLRDVSLKCSQEMKHREDDTASEVESSDTINKLDRCVTVVEERFHNCNPSCLPQLDNEQDNINLPYEGHFIIDAFVVPDKKEEGDDDSTISIQVILEMYSHTKYGTSILNKIRGSLQGEITRTNRRWRRLRKRQAEEV